MEATIIAEDERGVGVRVTDNNAVEHTVSVGFDGDIQGHGQDGYPDEPSARTETGTEHVNQARRYAKYAVYRECGYDTLDPYRNPDRVLSAGLAVAALDTGGVERYFGDLYRQVRSHYTDDQRQVSLPDGVGTANVTYRKDVYLGLPADAVDTVGGVHDDDARQADIEAVRERDRTVSLAALRASVEDIEADLPELGGEWIEAVSGVHVYWDDAAGQYHTEWTDRPDIDRDPEARIDLLPFEPASLDSFRDQLVRALWCQVRDCYLGMGAKPPEAFRITGMGSYSHATWYDHYDLYQPYHDPEATIDWDDVC